jgi:hypothetical protein
MTYNQKSSTAAAASIVAKVSGARVLHIIGYNAKASAQFIQLHDAAAVPGDLTAQVSTVDLATLTPAALADKYFLISSPTVDYYVWFNLDTGGVDPAVADRTAIPVAIATGNTAAQMATAAAAAIDALAAFVSAAVSTVITITNAVSGAANATTAGNSGAAVVVTVAGVSSAVPVAVITVPASSNFQIPLPHYGLYCHNGVVVCNSSAYATKVAGSADCFFTVQTE